MSGIHAALGRELVETAVLRGSFRLRSGETSSYYIDKYLFTTRPELLRQVAHEIASRVPSEAQRIAGPALGAIPIVTAVALEMNLPMLLVRVDQGKEYGTGKRIEGALNAGDRVVVVEDVVTTGGAALATVDALRAAGADVLGTIAVIDREQGGAAAFQAADVPLQALFTKTQLGL